MASSSFDVSRDFAPSLTDLLREQVDHFVHILARVFATDVARIVLAQIIEGRPTWDAYRFYPWTHSDIRPTDAPSKASYAKLNKFWIEFDIRTLRISNARSRASDIRKRLHDFNNSVPVLIELVAAVWHELAIIIHSLARDTRTASQAYTSFYHSKYSKEGVAAIGLWAQWQLFGGIVLSESGDSLHPVRAVIEPAAGFKAFRLSTKQVDEFTKFVSHDDLDDEACPLPFQADDSDSRLSDGDLSEIKIKSASFHANVSESLSLSGGGNCVSRLSDDPLLWRYVNAQPD